MRLIVTATWDDNAPHLDPAVKTALLASIPSFQIDARTRGVPQLGAGVIYPIPESELLIDAFPIPKHWPIGYGLDVGWNFTAACWHTFDPDEDPLARTVYLIDCYKRSEADPTIHAAAIRARGTWIPGRIDPAARGRSQADGIKLLHTYRKEIYGHDDLSVGVQMLGLANNGVETGIYDVWMLMNQGRYKVFKRRCADWVAEWRLYRRDERGQIIKKNDHAMDAERYGVSSGFAWFKPKPAPAVETDPLARLTRGSGGHDLSWMGAV
jgi:hypothetical protein